LFSFVVKKTANRKQLKRLRIFANELKRDNPLIVGVTLNVNSARGNVIVGRDTSVLEGRGWISEQVCDLDFHYGTTAFFQVNPLQAEQLFSYVCQEAFADRFYNVLELYSGVGVLTAMLAVKARKVTAVEEWPSSVDSLKKNLSLNSINNVKVIQGRVEDLTDRLSGEEHEVVVIDPPRSGCTEPVLAFMKEYLPLRIIYVSCNPATLARDIAVLCEDGVYYLDKVNTFDMFPQTVHVESVATLIRRES
jgi:23S rRNA (uracil1939-C5)-methyltransferase